MTEQEKRKANRNSKCQISRRKKYNDYNHSGLRDKIYAAFGNECALCGWKLDSQIVSGCHIHHITPVCEGGENSFDNLICLCPNCHTTVHHFDSLELRKRLQEKTKSEADYFQAKMLQQVVSNNQLADLLSASCQ